MSKATKITDESLWAGAYSGICPGGGLNLFLSKGGRVQHPLEHENPLKSIDFTGQVGGGSAPIAPLKYASVYDVKSKTKGLRQSKKYM